MSQDSINTIGGDVSETQLSYFEFKLIKPANVESDVQETDENNLIYKIPCKRSGHRAVCNYDYLWVYIIKLFNLYFNLLKILFFY